MTQNDMSSPYFCSSAHSQRSKEKIAITSTPQQILSPTNLMSIQRKQKSSRIYCDFCEMFDLHETEGKYSKIPINYFLGLFNIAFIFYIRLS